MFDQRMNQDIGFDNSIIGNNNRIDNNVDVDINMKGMKNSSNNNFVSSNHGVRERVSNSTFVHDVPHSCPIHTRIINHHVYRHIYKPVYTCSEENTVSNVQCGSCSQFR